MAVPSPFAELYHLDEFEVLCISLNVDLDAFSAHLDMFRDSKPEQSFLNRRLAVAVPIALHDVMYVPSAVLSVMAKEKPRKQVYLLDARANIWKQKKSSMAVQSRPFPWDERHPEFSHLPVSGIKRLEGSTAQWCRGLDQGLPAGQAPFHIVDAHHLSPAHQIDSKLLMNRENARSSRANAVLASANTNAEFTFTKRQNSDRCHHSLQSSIPAPPRRPTARMLPPYHAETDAFAYSTNSRLEKDGSAHLTISTWKRSNLIPQTRFKHLLIRTHQIRTHRNHSNHLNIQVLPPTPLNER
ncbi:hypothetical protein BS47DRAFT_1391903 [Hydnum rufescens UP504]|uniref:Uncharacterized protein n=1 Tax=Hydnum rufescens UP504 TaxID=1448309 RepID=A0A9P6B0N5_9AGAM|nr:hypothetical protein BS47DRAFT_1391903 [Hydnum rufescens UP504]